MLIVRALEAGFWPHVPTGPDGEYKRTLAVAGVRGRWCVNGVGVDVWPGLVLGFEDATSAQFFKASEKAWLPIVEVGSILAFHADSDALYFVNQGQAEIVSQQEAQAIFEQAKAAAEAKRLDPLDALDAPAPKLKMVKSDKVRGRI